MKNCAQSPTKLRESILNIVNHYQVSHEHVTSFLVCLYSIFALQRTSTQNAMRNLLVDVLGIVPPSSTYLSCCNTGIWEGTEDYTHLQKCGIILSGKYLCLAFTTMVEQAYLPLVSRYFLDWVIQSSAAHLPSQTNSFWLHNLQDENESCLYGLGMLLIQFCSHSS